MTSIDTRNMFAAHLMSGMITDLSVGNPYLKNIAEENEPELIVQVTAEQARDEFRLAMIKNAFDIADMMVEYSKNTSENY